MADATTRPARWHRRATLPLILLVALAMRLVAVAAVQLYTQQKGIPCLFGDTAIYWGLADAIRTGAPYVVHQGTIPHHALRTPGYPAFLALCQLAFGPDNTLAARVVQAVLGTVGVGCLYGLVLAVFGAGPHSERRRARTIAALAAAIAAVEPYTVGLSALLLSEAIFVPLMLVALWAIAVLWRPRHTDPDDPEAPGRSRSLVLAVVAGTAIGGALLARPSWALFVPALVLAWLVIERRVRALRLALVIALATAATMAPWWVRNAQVYGRFVPTALWVGASLYDAVSPAATGSSDMRFLEDPAFARLGEVEQDRVFREKAVAFARENPDRFFELAAVKLGRFWSPWPNADELDAPGVAPLSAAATLPVFGLLLVGVWGRRRDPRTLVLLLGTLLYFSALHAVFVGSIRYRLPGMVPAFGLAAAGMVRLVGGPPGRAERAAWRLAAWAVVMPVLVLVGGGWYAVHHATDGEELARLIEREAVRLLPTSVLDVGRVQIRPFEGSAKLEYLKVFQDIEVLKRQPTVEVGYLQVRFDLWALLHGQFRPRELVITHPTLRVCRRPDGTWNLQGMLADPWPLPPPERLPTVHVRNGTLLLTEADGSVAVLRDVTATLEPVSATVFGLDGTARGDGFERLRLTGAFNATTNRLTLAGGELTRLELGEVFRERLPREWHDAYERLGLTGGELDLIVRRLIVDPRAPDGPIVAQDFDVLLRSGTWNCPNLPFPLNELELLGAVDGGRLVVERATGTNGRTRAIAAGWLDLTDPERGPFDLLVEVTDLEFDDRLLRKAPPELVGVWREFRPSGRFDAYLKVVRRHPGAAPQLGLTVDLQDVALTYKWCPYPLEHVSGRLIWEQDRVTIEEPGLRTMIGSRPARCWGSIDHPGPAALVSLDFTLGALPIDQKLLAALAPEVREVFDQFQPKGTVRVVKAHIGRRPPPPGMPENVVVNAELALGEPAEAGGFAFTWEGMPYPITNVTGRLLIGPSEWEFRDLRGSNGLARLAGDGKVRHRGGDRFDAELSLHARDLRFDAQLYRALPPEWQGTWRLLNPAGVASVDASINVADNVNHTVMTVRPDPGTSIRLKFTPAPEVPGGPDPPPLELPAMENIGGTFTYDDGLVRMDDVRFGFRGSDVRFAEGEVNLARDGRFGLRMDGLRVAQFRLDAGLRRLMPEAMADAARRLDETPPIPSMRGDLRLGWSGRPGDPAWVEWSDGLVVLDGQTINAGLPLESIQGRLRDVSGRFDGRALGLTGVVDLDSLTVFGQQLTGLRTPLVVDPDSVRLTRIEGALLGGLMTGQVRVGLNPQSDYAARLAIADADLARFTATLPGKQEFRGLLSGQLALNGLGSDPRSMRGLGDFRIEQGDLGDLPVVFRFFKFLNTLDLAAPTDSTAFDTAAVSVRIEDGDAYLDPIELSGDALSLRGAGRMDLRGELDLRLRIIYGRDGLRIPLLSDAIREAGGQIVDIRVSGPASFPQFRSEVLPGGQRVLRSLGSGFFGSTRDAPLLER